MMTERIGLIAVDWGTTNRRAWATSASGEVLDERGDGEGLLALTPNLFPHSFAAFAAPWLSETRSLPVLMCGMVGSKLGWAEVPYLAAPADLGDLARNLSAIPFDGPAKIFVVPGVSCEERGVPDVMRGEECQILAVLASRRLRDACLVLPGTHSKWAIVRHGRLVAFRTYLTGELYDALISSGTLAQLMEDGGADESSFIQGVDRIREGGSESLSHVLFGVRTLALFDKLPRTALASYLSGLLIGSELRDAVSWARAHSVIAVGSPALLENYRVAAARFGVGFEAEDNNALLPRALHSIARDAGLIG